MTTGEASTGPQEREVVVEVLDPSELYALVPDLPEALEQPRPGGLVLVQAMSGFVDAGEGSRLATEHMLSTMESSVVATFDHDQLHDYRARRPLMLFDEDHWESYDDPELALHLVTDPAGVPFLLLRGPEPDVQWERFCAAVISLVSRLGVRLTLGMDAIPMAVPHTRPIGVTAHATRSELVAGYRPWIHQVQVPASAGHLLEYRLGQAGKDAMGFAVHVPHYLAQTEYPDAAVALLEALAAASGLTLPAEPLARTGEQTRAQVDAQVAESTDVATVVADLEAQYDAFVGARERGDVLADRAGDLPSGDELGAELERFLAQRSRHPDDPDT